ncbi:hypothetical protein MUP38_01640, partial [Candidatus Bathyarchaeota archaeon]|nr:hypothetical protein [Candidatus Bathyarchaeota archaeon]
DIDSRTWETYPRTEPTIPYYIGEWDVELKPKGKTVGGVQDQQMYRFVTVYGVTSRNDADDANIPATYYNLYNGFNTIDSETKYQLNEVFNPWDLNTAVHKTTRSWVEWTTASNWVGNVMTFKTTRKPVIVVPNSQWNQYGVNSERVIDVNGSAGMTGMLYRSYSWFGGEYSISSNADGTATITIDQSASSTTFHGNVSGHIFKILYSTLPDVTGSQVKTVNTPVATSTINATSVTVASRTLSDSWTDNIGVGHTFKVTFPSFTVYGDPSAGTGNWTQTWTLRKMWNETDFKVFLGETYISTIPNLIDPINVTMPEVDFKIAAYLDGGSVETGRVTFLFDIDTLEKSVTAPTNASVISPLDKETTHVVYLNHTLDITITVTNMNITNVPLGQTPTSTNSTLSVTFDSTMQADYNDKLMGRYEWAVVGRDAASVDSAGAALVTAAFKEKQVEIGMAGADMYDPEVANQMPWVMSKMTAGDEWVNYLKTGAGTDPGNYRAYLRDDWCRAGTTSGDEWPVASSNMIGVGGPLANLLSYYANDFTSAIFGLSDFTNYTAWKNKIAPVTCWNHTQGYTDTNTVGYAVVSTYLDLNGTVVFLVWGNWGRDTFYVSRYFLEHLVYQLQEAPSGITSVVVKINYESAGEGYKPTSFSIVECLGTISERLWLHVSQSQFFWEGTAYSTTGAIVTTPTLQSGTTYRIEAQEIFWYDYGNSLEADAMYYTTATAGWNWENHFPAPGGHSFLQMNGADVNWGPFSNGDTVHTYSIQYVGQGTPVTFQIVDWMDQNYTNNNCHLPIFIYIETGEHKGGIHDP